MDFSHGHRTFLTAIANRRVMVGLFCSCVKIVDYAVVPVNEILFYTCVLVSTASAILPCQRTISRLSDVKFGDCSMNPVSGLV